MAAGYAPSGVSYLLPVPALRRAWRQHGREWVERFGQRRVLNPGYVSVGVPVPRPILMWAIGEAMMIGGAK